MKLNIVTIHLNDFTGLKRTLKSLGSVIGDDNLEWIVIDGDSKRHDDKDDILGRVELAADLFISAPDEGIYDAMNKGTQLANGDYVLYLNAGDELHENFRLTLLDEQLTASRPEMIWGDCLERYENGSLIQVKTRSPSWAWYCMPVYHPAAFFRQDMLGDSPYDTRYRIAADYDLVCRLISNGAQVVKLDSLVSIFHRGGLSNVQGKATREEENRVRTKYFQIPTIAGRLIIIFKSINARLAGITWLRSIWRKWI